MAANENVARALGSLQVDVVEAGGKAKRNWTRCALNEHITFSAHSLASYFFASPNLTVYDAFLVAAAAEFCDRTKRRPANGWGRELQVRIPVHEPDLWNSKPVSEALHEALRVLTGDRWEIAFHARKKPEEVPHQGLLDLGRSVSKVIPYSDGLDSRAVAGLMMKKLGDGLVRVRLGTAEPDENSHKEPFTAVPYTVKSPEHTPEPSARVRGFKFALIGGLSAFLAKADAVILPESGQGALGPTIVPVGQAYVDYRNHPIFTAHMETFLYRLLGHCVRFEFPQLWYTKGETLRMFIESCGSATSRLLGTRSCWQGNRHASVNGERRQCGICAACMLRRMSFHAAGVIEPPENYVWEDLSADSLEAGASPDFSRKKITKAMQHYAIAGALHMDHLAALRHSPANAALLDLSTFRLSRALGMSQADARARLDRLLTQHEIEWKEYMRSLGPTSFVAAWAAHGYDHAA